MKLKAIVGVALDRMHENDEANINGTKADFIKALGDGSDVDGGDNTQGTVNDTDSELSALSHVDAPNDVIYMVCGVVIAMLLVGLIIVLVAVTINKLRKREETSSGSPVTIEAQHTFGGNGCGGAVITTTTTSSQNHHHHLYHRNNINIINNNCNHNNSNGNSAHCAVQQQISTTSLIDCNSLNPNNYNNGGVVVCNGAATTIQQTQSQPQIGYRTSGVGPEVITNGWVFPPKAPTPNIYNCNNNFDALIAANEKHGFKGFRKQFSGRFKRLVAKKPQEPAPAIPPELKSQLKTIYVY